MKISDSKHTVGIMPYPVPENENERLCALHGYHILDSLAEQEYDDIVLLLANICHTPMATIAFLDEDRKWHKAKYGLDKTFVAREAAICSYTILQSEPLIVEDTLQHPDFCHIGMVTQPPFVRFYAGVALINQQGFPLGTLCTIDTKPNCLNEFQITALKALGRQVVALLELRRSVFALEQQKQQVEELNGQLKRSSLTDELSGLWNRRAMEQWLQQADAYTSLSLVMLDLDNFKQLNDSFGHDSGDEAIRLLGLVMQKHTREQDMCIRVGGDEFIILIPDASAESAKLCLKKVCEEISAIDTLPVGITVSAGIAHTDCPQGCHRSLRELADQSLYQAKQQGKNRIVTSCLKSQ